MRPRSGYWLAVTSLWVLAVPIRAQTPSPPALGLTLLRLPAAVGQTDEEEEEMQNEEEEEEEEQPAQVPASRPAAGVMSSATAPTGVRPRARPKGLFGLPAAPLTEPIETDQGSFSITPYLVPTGHLQLETNYSFERDHAGGAGTRLQEHSGPDTLLRAGVTDKLELRMEWGGYSFTKQRESQDFGLGEKADWTQGGDDLLVGTKFKLLEQRGILPDVGLVTALRFPTGTNPRIASTHVEPLAVLAWGKDLTDRISLEGNVGLAVPSPETGQFLQTSASIYLEAKLIDHLFGYVEYFGHYPNELHHDCAHNMDVGLRYTLTNNTELFALVGTGLNHEAPALFASAGFAMRF